MRVEIPSGSPIFKRNVIETTSNVGGWLRGSHPPKEDAIRNLFLQIGFHAGVGAMKWHAQEADPIEEHDL